MAEFKVGDRIRALHTSGGGGVQAGDVFVVTKSEDGYLNFFNHRVGRDDGWGANYFELALTLETGTFYRTRSGKVTGRVTVGDTGFEAVVEGSVRIFDNSGGAVHGDDDIVEAWVPKVGERVRIKSAKLSSHQRHEGKRTWTGDNSFGVVWLAEELEPLPVAVPQPASTTNVGAQVDTLAEEYGPARVAAASTAEEAKPKFKVGDRVVFRNYSGSEHCYGTVEDVSVDGKRVLASDWSIGAEVGYLPAADLELADTEPDTTLHIKFTSDFSELDAAILVRKKKLKKLIKLARKAGIDLREAA
jgi:hypothetical protein